MTDHTKAKGDEDGLDMPGFKFEPGLVYASHRMFSPGPWGEWTEHRRESAGRFKQRITYRYRNPFSGYHMFGAAYAAMLKLLDYAHPVKSIPGAPQGMESRLAFGAGIPWDMASVAVLTAGILLWAAGVFYAFDHRKEETTFNEAQMYPPKGYWDEATTNE